MTSTGVPGTRRRASIAARRPSSVKLGRQAHVGDGHVRPLPLDRLDQGVAVLDGGHDVHAVVAQQAGEAVAQQREVLGDHDPHGSSTRQDRTAAGGVRDGHDAVERLHPVAQAAQTLRRGVGPAPAVVGHHAPRAPASRRATPDRDPASPPLCLLALVSASATTK